MSVARPSDSVVKKFDSKAVDSVGYADARSEVFVCEGMLESSAEQVKVNSVVTVESALINSDIINSVHIETVSIELPSIEAVGVTTRIARPGSSSHAHTMVCTSLAGG